MMLTTQVTVIYCDLGLLFAAFLFGDLWKRIFIHEIVFSVSLEKIEENNRTYINQLQEETN